ncbi:hypothetical protein M9H77_16954 [Catharanthus roseus]|uniref:Uncharacterized protein n=1 Tax=Catharanthus roseus TaxID=4058 RepID=A0ACC0B3A5_CATRO|nr:hypothetical protein M9H77_16954 [Catharanthus roseus]
MKCSVTFAMAFFVLLLLSPATNVVAKRKKKASQQHASAPKPPLLQKSQAIPAPAPTPSPTPNPNYSLPELQAAAPPPSPIPPPNPPLIPGFSVFVDKCEGVDCFIVCAQYGTDSGGDCKTYQGFYYCSCL